MEKSTFFGLVVNPNFNYKTLLKDDVLLTNAVIDPEANGDQSARLLIKIDNTRVPLCQLDGSHVTCVPLNVQLFSDVEVTFSVAGDCPIHVTGFYSPQKETETPEFVSPGFDLGDANESNEAS